MTNNAYSAGSRENIPDRAGAVKPSHLSDEAILAAALAPNSVTTAKLLDANVTAPKLEEQVERITDVTASSAELLALFATPKTLIAAPGANKAIIFKEAIFYKPAGTAYAGIAAGEDLSVKYTDASGAELARVEATNFLDQATAQFRHARGYAAASAINDTTPTANAALVLHMLSGEIITGTSPLLVRVYYRIVPTVLT